MATDEANCGADELGDFAARVAERLLVDRSIERAPSASDYRIAPRPGPDGLPRLEVKLDLGRGVVIPVHCSWRSGAERASSIRKLSIALGILYEDSPKLLPVPHMAKLRIKKLAAAGVPCRLLSVAPVPFDADWEWTALLLLEIEGIDASLRLSREIYGATDRKSFARFLGGFERSQGERMSARSWFSGYGATAAIEVILLNALRGAGVDDVLLLRHLNVSRDKGLEVTAPDGTRFDLTWVNGCVTGRVTLEPGVVWCRGQLDFERAPRRFDIRNLGRRLVDIYPHALLPEGIIVRKARGQKGQRACLICSSSPMYPMHLENEVFVEVG